MSLRMESTKLENKTIRFYSKNSTLWFVCKDIVELCQMKWSRKDFNVIEGILSTETFNGISYKTMNYDAVISYLSASRSPLKNRIIALVSSLMSEFETSLSRIVINQITNVKDIKKEYLFPDTKVITAMLVRKGILKRKNKTYCTVEESARGYNWLCYTKQDFIFKGFFNTPELHNIILALKEEYINQPLLSVNTSNL